MKQFVYFFKHKGFNPIKIGRTSGESVNDRFAQFKTYSPHGGEIVGFFECKDAASMERILHSKFSYARLNGEWFDIPQSAVMSVIMKYDTKSEIKSIFNEWVSKPENDINRLLLLMSESSKEFKINTERKEYALCKQFITESTEYSMTATRITNILSSFTESDLSVRSIGLSLGELGFVAKHIKRNGKTERLYKVDWVTDFKRKLEM